jgi:hypothetical protein
MIRTKIKAIAVLSTPALLLLVFAFAPASANSAPMEIAPARPGGGHLTSPTRRGFASQGRRHPRPSAKPLTTWICISERILSALGRGPKRERISIRSI